MLSLNVCLEKRHSRDDSRGAARYFSRTASARDYKATHQQQFSNQLGFERTVTLSQITQSPLASRQSSSLASLSCCPSPRLSDSCAMAQIRGLAANDARREGSECEVDAGPCKGACEDRKEGSPMKCLQDCSSLCGGERSQTVRDHVRLAKFSTAHNDRAEAQRTTDVVYRQFVQKDLVHMQHQTITRHFWFFAFPHRSA